MQLVHTFSVPVAIDDAWVTLLDFENVAPCLPGARLDRVDGDEIEGAVKVKLGPVMLDYRGVATVTECDAQTRRMSFTGSGRDPRGNSSASATVTASLAGGVGSEPTSVTVTTDLDVTGRPAQFGRGMMQEVGNRVIGQFADRLASQLDGTRVPESQVSTVNDGRRTDGVRPDIATSPPSAPRRTRTAAPGRLRPTKDLEPEAWASLRADPHPGSPDATPAFESTDDEALDLGAAAGPALIKRAAPVVGVALLLAIAGARLRRRRRAGRGRRTRGVDPARDDLVTLARSLQASSVVFPSVESSVLFNKIVDELGSVSDR